MNTQTYFKNLERDVKKVYVVAEEAREKNLDPVDKVEIPLAMNMAEKVVGIISTIYPQMMDSGIAKRILELEKEYGKLDTTVSFKITEEVAKQKFCKFSSLVEAMEAGIRIGFAYQTIGVVSSPMEGFTGLKLRKTLEGNGNPGLMKKAEEANEFIIAMKQKDKSNSKLALTVLGNTLSANSLQM